VKEHSAEPHGAHFFKALSRCSPPAITLGLGPPGVVAVTLGEEEDGRRLSDRDELVVWIVPEVEVPISMPTDAMRQNSKANPVKGIVLRTIWRKRDRIEG
jgi:hypothetical protein